MLENISGKTFKINDYHICQSQQHKPQYDLNNLYFTHINAHKYKEKEKSKS